MPRQGERGGVECHVEDAAEMDRDPGGEVFDYRGCESAVARRFCGSTSGFYADCEIYRHLAPDGGGGRNCVSDSNLPFRQRPGQLADVRVHTPR